jgi:hypothetical protein
MLPAYWIVDVRYVVAQSETVVALVVSVPQYYSYD